MRDRLVLSMIGLVSALVVAAVGFLLLGRRAPTGPELDVSTLPAVNAFLNGISAALLTGGYLCIRRRKVAGHMTCMLSAFCVSVLFLISYVAYHYQAGSRPFGGHGWIRWGYLALLISHIVLAALIVPLALTTIYRAWRGQLGRHVSLARWTLPLWLYVSVTGVIVYWMLYHLARPP